MSKLERLSERFLTVGTHPLNLCLKSRKEKKSKEDSFDFPDDNVHDTQACLCCHTDSPAYIRCWPVIFLFSVITDFAMPLPKGKKPGQHRDWGWLPVMIISTIAILAFVGYISRFILVLLHQLNRKKEAVGCLVPACAFFIFFFLSYARIVTKTPGHPKPLFRDGDTLSVNSSRSLLSTDARHEESQLKPFTILGNVKWCEACQVWKPDRAHHCRVCDACILRMDHHCPWVNGCVGIKNHRYYIQFLFYASLYASFVFLTSIIIFIQSRGLATFDGIALVVVIVAGIFTIVIGPFTMSHIWLIFINRTTIENSQFQKWKKARKAGKAENRLIEMFTETEKNVFNCGLKSNWMEIMGKDKLLWFLPLKSVEDRKIDGVYYRYNEEALQEYRSEDASRRIKKTDQINHLATAK
ncbi:DHHC palmitoyltransferase-domain-containing protein [Mycotypha africana]|uniref:DHHC palmitoyltransferase-domain-containing protein n=1 Tax=Mycotypha africana TaxID=64632 RepID=UPI002300D3D3|nr:DHHC palmitoyltransferase-domain-containing protein [Mycotypha africana]KAI8991773.1 DHHC palmitoyltransferase-domain-containing protein [Mycotypha africana]